MLCSKVWYTSEKQAKEVMHFLKWKGNRLHKVPKRIYKCPFCLLFHITSIKYDRYNTKKQTLIHKD